MIHLPLTVDDRERLAELEREIAYGSARCDIESHSKWPEPLKVGQPNWHDITPGLLDENACEFVEDAKEYLELLGLLEIHLEHENWVRIKDLSEAVDA